jgi:DHA1 family tetracycline resistance protein-like MFS transporter
VKDRRLLIIFGIVLVDMLSFSLVLPLLPYYAKEFGASPMVTGLIFSSYPLMQVLAAPFLGRLSDVWGRKPVLLLSIAGTACALLMLGLANSLWMLFASRMLDGITGGNISVAQAYMTDVTSEKDRGKAFGLIGAAFGIGFILGPVSGGLLAGISQPLPAFVAAGLAASTCCWCCLSCQSRSRPSAARRSRPSPPRAGRCMSWVPLWVFPASAPCCGSAS